MATKKTTSNTKTAPARKQAAKKPAATAKKPAAAKKTTGKKATPAPKPATKSTGTKRPAAKKPAAEKPAAKKPAAKKPAAKKPAAKKPAATKKTAVVKPAGTRKPAAKKPAAKKPAAAKKAATSKPTAKKPTGGAKAVAGPAAPRISRKAPTFSIGDKVVHPQHGAAIIVKKVKQTVVGNRQDYYQLEIATDQLTVFVPVASIEETIRPVISKNQARKVFSLFKEPPQEAGSNWSRWYKVLNEKMTSGDIYQVAEVVRDLSFAQQTKGISPALKRMLSKARLTLTSELRFALNVDEEEATKKLDRALPKVEVLEEV